MNVNRKEKARKDKLILEEYLTLIDSGMALSSIYAQVSINLQSIGVMVTPAKIQKVVLEAKKGGRND